MTTRKEIIKQTQSSTYLDLFGAFQHLFRVVFVDPKNEGDEPFFGLRLELVHHAKIVKDEAAALLRVALQVARMLQRRVRERRVVG